MDSFLIVGLGNPGLIYENTRHNIGFKIVTAFGSKYGAKFSRNAKLKSKMAHTKVLDEDVFLQKPLTYMNNSGQAIRACIDFYKIDISHILVIVDDAEIPFGEFRIKEGSGSGGHNGLKSIEQYLKTNEYARLRVGIGRENENLKSYVLSRFSKDEKEKLEDIKSQAITLIEMWIKEGTQKTANTANIRKKAKKNVEEN